MLKKYTTKAPIEVWSSADFVIENCYSEFSATEYREYAIVANNRRANGDIERVSIYVRSDLLTFYIPKNKTLGSNHVLNIYANSDYNEDVYFENIKLSPIKKGWNSFNISNHEYMNLLGDIKQKNSLSCNNANHLKFDSSRGLNKPYLLVEYTDTPPDVKSLFPNNANVDARNDIKVSWEYYSAESTKMSGFEIQYRNENGSWIKKSGNNSFFIIPKNTFKTNSIAELKVRVKDSRGYWSNWKSARFTTNIIKQKPPVILYPTSGFLNGDEEIELSWEFVGGFDYEQQYKYDVQISNDMSNWRTYTQVSKIPKHTFPKSSLTSGTIYWKVRTYNEHGDVSPYSNIEKFNVISSPPIPNIVSISSAGKPLIKWQSVDQERYRLEIEDSNNNIIYKTSENSKSKEHLVNKFLPIGKFIAKLSISNQFNIESSQAIKSFTVDESESLKPDLKVFPGNYMNIIQGSNDVYVYRDNKELGPIKNGVFFDYTFTNNKKHIYFLRSIDKNMLYVDSDPIVIKNTFKYNTISLASRPDDFIMLKYGFNSPPKKSGNLNLQGGLQYYDGRKYGVAEYTEHIQYSLSLIFYIDSHEDKNKLLDFISSKKDLLYRDTTGRNYIGNIFNLSFRKNDYFGYEVNFILDITGDLND